MRDNCPTCDNTTTISAPYVRVAPDTHEKLSILSQESQYDLACACGVNETDARRRSRDDKWIYPVTFENGRKTFLFKTLVSNECINNCRYCPLRVRIDSRRCTLTPEENESVMQYAIDNFDVGLEEFKLPVKSRQGIPEWHGEKFSDEIKKVHRIYPQDNDAEGFFVAKLRKKGE